VEARIYAEDAAHGFLPQSGTVRRLRWPNGPGVRVDASLTGTGQTVNASYDPLLAKIICWGTNRADALARLDAALADTVVLGVPSTTGVLRRVIATPEFKAGGIDTGFLSRHPELTAPALPPLDVLLAAASAASGGPPPWQALAGWRQGVGRLPIRVEVDGRWYQVPLPPAAPGSEDVGEVAVLPVTSEEGRAGVEVCLGGSRWLLWFDTPVAPLVSAARISSAESAAVEVPEERLSAAGNWFVVAPLSGKAGARVAEVGATLEPATTVTSIEAMKMQHAITAGRPARLVRWLVEPGAFVRAGQAIAELAPSDPGARDEDQPGDKRRPAGPAELRGAPSPETGSA
jgi:acetyl-CoA/propionyl-CoA carboxylase biotin carboxyl carrier protein